MGIERFRGDYSKLSEWCKGEYTFALQARGPLERRMLEWQRLYEARPRVATRVWPWIGASNLEVPLIKTHVVSIEAQIEDAYFSTKPTVVCRSFREEFRDHAFALQRWLNEVELTNANFKSSRINGILSTIKFGSSFTHIQWKRQFSQIVSQGKKQNVVHFDGPMIYYLHPNNVIWPYNTHDVQSTRWIAFRTFKTWNELISEFYEGHYSREVLEKLKGEGKRLNDPFLAQQFTNEHSSGNYNVDLWEIVTMFAFYQTDDFELPQNLWITFDYPSGLILEAFYNPLMHYQRPLFKSDYMISDGRFIGTGVCEMLEMLQNEMSDTHNYSLDNQLLANTILIAGQKNSIEKFDVHPMGIVTTFKDPKESIMPLQLGRPFSGLTQQEQIDNLYAERLTGIGDVPQLGSFRAAGQVRTPATTALALLGQGNKRFKIAIGNAKDADTEMLRQFVQLEYQFWPLRRADAYEWSPKEARLLDELFNRLSPKAFSRNIAVEINASNEALNKTAEQQNLFILTDRMVQIFEYLIRLRQMMVEAPHLADIAQKAFDVATKWGKMLLEQFDVRDPDQYFPSETEISGTRTPAQAQERADIIGARFVEQALRNIEARNFTNGQRGASFIAASQAASSNGNGNGIG